LFCLLELQSQSWLCWSWKAHMDRYYESKALTGLGNARLDAGDLASARQAWQGALAILEDLGHSDAGQLRVRIAGATAAATRAAP
jgi:hypothetical protein